MDGKVVHGTTLDSVRIDRIGEGRALTVPCSLIVDVDTALRRVADAMDGTLIVHRIRDDMWMAECDFGNVSGAGCTPLQAIAAMAEGGGK